MTTMPIAPAPPGPAPTTPGTNGLTGGDNAGANDPLVPGGFLALVQQALAAALGAKAGTGTAAGESATDAGTDPATDHTDAGLDAAMAAAANGLSALVPTLPVASATAPSATSLAELPAGVAPSSPGGTRRGTLPGVPDPSGTPGMPATPTDAPEAGTSAAGLDASAPVTTATGTGASNHSTDHDDAEPAMPAPPVMPAAPADPGVAPTIGTAAAVPGAHSATHTPGTAQAHHVTSQVFPEVTSLVSRGNGAHRITMTLTPEALGEVRIVMTVRDGSVHVRLAAGHEAQQALLSGSSELTRLLQRAGASDSQIVVRDLPTGSASATGSTTPDPGSSTGSGPGAYLGDGGGRPHDRHAGTRADQPATDGTNDGSTRGIRGAAGSVQPRSIEPVTGTRLAGVDVTM